MKKFCKQCGILLDEDSFRQYVPRGKGIYHTTVGRHTVCRDCENFNARIARLYKTDPTSPKLDEAARLYVDLHNRGLEPVGAYARVVLADREQNKVQEDSYDAYIRRVREYDINIASRFAALLDLPFVKEPDYYRDKLDAIVETCVDKAGRVKAEYLDLFNAVSTKIDDYESSYKWTD